MLDCPSFEKLTCQNCDKFEMIPHDAFTWIVTTPERQSVEVERKQIRSHAKRGKGCKKMPLRPLSWISGCKLNSPVELGTENALSIPRDVGRECCFTVFSVEIGPEIVESMWKRKRTPPSLYSYLV